MVDHIIRTQEGKKGNYFFQIRNKVKEERSFGNALKRKEGRSLGNGGSNLLDVHIILHKAKNLYFLLFVLN